MKYIILVHGLTGCLTNLTKISVTKTIDIIEGAVGLEHNGYFQNNSNIHHTPLPYYCPQLANFNHIKNPLRPKN
jgi:hypothetical protein